MSGLMFPKRPKAKKRKKHPKSIIRQQDGTCYLCMLLNDDCRMHRVLHDHHIFGGPNRRWSEEYGLKVKLCVEHHEYGPYAVHQNADISDMLHRIGQQAFEDVHKDEDFVDIFGKNYL